MQLAVAGLFVVEAAFSILTSAIYVNHEHMLRVMQTVGRDLPQGTDADSAATAAVVSTWIVVIVIAGIEVVVALGSNLGWRWMFWVALVLLGFGTILAITSLGSLGIQDTSPVPDWARAVDKVLSIAAFALFAWMLIGAIRLGPWAMKRAGT
jgi:hypothetical protein